MLRYAIRQLILLILTMVALSILVFAATRALSGDAATQILDHYGGEARVQEIRVQLGLDQPGWKQLLHWISGAVRLDFGNSLILRTPVSGLVMTAFGRSALVIGLSMCVTAIAGVGFGLMAGLRQGRWMDTSLVSLTLLAVSIPEFLLALIIILVFAIWLGWFPAYGAAGGDDGFAGVASHTALPVLTLSLLTIPHVARVTRSSVIDAMATPYVRSATARGLHRWTIVRRYVLRNAMTPAIAVLALDVGQLLGGVVVVENVFGYPGLGQLTVSAITYRDIPLIQACALLLVLVFVLSNVAGDLAAAGLDPRVREGVAVLEHVAADKPSLTKRGRT